MRAILEEDIAVQVHVVRHGRPLIGAKGGELTRFVGLIREFDVVVPDGASDIGTHQCLVWRPTAEQFFAVEIDPLNLFRAVVLENKRGRSRHLVDWRTQLIGQFEHTDVLGMIGDAGEIQRGVDLDFIAERMLDRLALEILVGVAGVSYPVADEPGVERPTGVNVALSSARPGPTPTSTVYPFM
jgi:hypothetical protein